MKMRLDANGSPIRRSFIGNLEQYMMGHVSVQCKNLGNSAADKQLRKQSLKLALGGLNIINKETNDSTLVAAVK